MSDFIGIKRFIGDQREYYDKYIEAANEYPNITPKNKRVKPFFTPIEYCRHMYNILDVISIMDLPYKSRILEIGSGPGWITEILMAVGYIVDSIEPSETFIEEARQRVKSFSKHIGYVNPDELDKNITIKRGTAEELDVPAELYDAVLFFDVLHHVVNEEKALVNCFDALRKGGIICIHEYAWNPTNQELGAKLEQEMRLYGALENPFTTEYLDYLLQHSGFCNIERYYGINKPLSFASSYDHQQLARKEDLNFVVARKPWDYLTTRDGGAFTSGTLEVIKWDIVNCYLEVDVLLKNTGDSVWLVDHLLEMGYVTVALFNKCDRSEMDRRIISREMHPNDEETLHLEYYINDPSTFCASDWCFDLVNEQVHWFGLGVPLRGNDI